jgi:hypothetical protein
MKASSAFSCVVNPPGGITTCSTGFGFEVGVEVSLCLAEYAARALLLLGLKCSGLEDRIGGVGLAISLTHIRAGSAHLDMPLSFLLLFSALNSSS